MSRECDNNPDLDYKDHPAKVFIDVLKALDLLLVAGCFGKTLIEDYAAQIQSFSEKHDRCNISITSKVHAVKEHLEPFLNKHKVGLALFSEQALKPSIQSFL